MECRTFYDRVDKEVSTYVEVYDCESPVQPNLSLSIRDIFDRWKKNLPLDTVMRNGSFYPINGTPTDKDFEAVDPDTLDPAEANEYEERFTEAATRFSTQNNDKAEKRSDSAEVNDSASNRVEESVNLEGDFDDVSAEG